MSRKSPHIIDAKIMALETAIANPRLSVVERIKAKRELYELKNQRAARIGAQP